jgi:hypothetical protein
MSRQMMVENPKMVQIVVPAGKGVLQRTCRKCGGKDKERKKGILRRSAVQDCPEWVPPIVHKVLSSPGQQLDSSTRAFMEPRFGHDFSKVRIHVDAEAENAARSVQARAYTIGRDIVFGSGAFMPDTREGTRLLAHELAHVVQQRSSGEDSLSMQIRVGESDSLQEQEADLIADTVIGSSSSIPWAVRGFDGPGWTIQRDKGDGGKAKAPPPWTVDDLKKMLDTCDGGLGILAKAKKANKDKDPEIVPGTEGATDTVTGKITLDKTQDKCFAVQQLVQELSNLSRKADFDKLDNSAMAGDVNRADYIKQTEQIEFETGVKNVLTAFDACKDKWGCKTTPKEWARKAKNFDEYFAKLLSDTHKEFYGKWWDDNCKAAFDKKHAKK